MTKRQKTMWDKRMLQMEIRAVNYYRRKDTDEPDGSFFRGAFNDGYQVAKREAAKRSGK